MRLDLSVNILTNFAYNKKFIKVFGGKQLRPNLHILDYCGAVLKLINSPSAKIQNKIFNVGHENMSINKIASLVKKTIQKKMGQKIKIIKTKSNDLRSYHINSNKISKELGFVPKKNIEQAVIEIYNALKSKKITNSFSNLNYYNVEKIKKLKIK